MPDGTAETIIRNSYAFELTAVEGMAGQHPESGKMGVGSLLGQYTNRLFGAPFQLLDSVDRRFASVNANVGGEYLRNFLLHSPILSIRPGMPRYTGDRDMSSAGSVLKNLYYDVEGGSGFVESLMNELASATIFGSGSKLQRRMFGFRETYYDYMQHVNYMCRSCAVFLNLTEGGQFPNYTYSAGGEQLEFSSARWENYRFMVGSHAQTPMEYMQTLMNVGGSKVVAAGKSFIGGGIDVGSWIASKIPGCNIDDLNTGTDGLKDFLGVNTDDIDIAWTTAEQSTFANALEDKVSCVQFMVDPSDFSESLSNTTEPSVIETAVDAVTTSVGSELAWITNSRADVGMLDGLLSFMGDVTTTALTTISSLMKPVTGGFIDNVFNGAIRSIKGQKMIYPEIYKTSKSTMNYEFTVTLTTPYGDIYNYYMNILVPLLHLIALAAPRMVTSNTTTSPYIVQAYIPGMCTCQLGIVENMAITKNPTTKHVSVNGFPLTVKVTFTIKELYNALAISPANDPASFLYNETLNDYMANLSGLIPSVGTYQRQREVMFGNLEEYFKSGEYMNDMVAPFNEWAENKGSPFT